MKKLPAFLASLLLCPLLLCLPVHAAEPGDMLGWAYFPENTVTLDSMFIPGYEIEGKVCLIAEDLTEYGFAVEWHPDEERLIIRTERTAFPDEYSIHSHYAETYNMVHLAAPGERVFPYLCTRITTWIGEEQVTGYNIGGRTCVPIDELVRTRIARAYPEYGGRVALVTFGSVPAEDEWTFSYDTPGYSGGALDRDIPRDGEYAVWEFTKNEAGEFECISSEGAVGFTPRIGFGADRMYYTVERICGENYIWVTRYPILAHTAAEADFWRLGAWDSAADGRRLYPAYYRGYEAIDPDGAALLRAGRQGEELARRTLRVWYNGEPMDGICAADCTGDMGSGPYTSFLLFSRLYAIDEIDRVRIELRLP